MLFCFLSCFTTLRLRDMFSMKVSEWGQEIHRRSRRKATCWFTCINSSDQEAVIVVMRRELVVPHGCCGGDGKGLELKNNIILYIYSLFIFLMFSLTLSNLSLSLFVYISIISRPLGALNHKKKFSPLCVETISITEKTNLALLSMEIS